ncbi:MAG: RICIN domain-containing protein [Polyangiales bacterium]
MRTKPLLAITACVALVGGVALLSVSDAAAEAIRHVHGVNFKVVSQLDESFCLDASLDKGEEGKEVYLFKCHGRENQRWTFTDTKDSKTVIVGHKGMCLDVRGRKAGDGTPIQLWKCHYGDNQKFEYTSGGQIKDAHSGKCLEVAGAADRKPVYINDCDDKKASQRWNLAR